MTSEQGLGPSERMWVRWVEEKNRKLKRVVADLPQDNAMLEDVW